MRKAFFLAALAAALSPLPLAAQSRAEESAESFEIIDHLLSAEDARLRGRVIDALAEPDGDRRVAKLDALAQSVAQPSAAHAFLASQAASMLASIGRDDEAKSRFEKLLGRYPSYPPVRVQAIDSLAYTREAPEAARLWMELAAIHPALAKVLDGYTLGALSSNLRAQGRTDTRDALMLALDRIGYDPGSTALRSEMLEAIFQNASGDPTRDAEARAALRRFDDPEAVRGILANRHYERFWPDIATDQAAWIARAEKHIASLADDAARAEDGVVAGLFIRTAQSLAGPEGVLANYLPRLNAVLSSEALADETDEYAFWVASLASALAQTGDVAAAEWLFQKSASHFAGMNSVNRLNVAANYARFLVREGRSHEALEVIEPAIAELDAMNTSNLARVQMEGVRVRALHALDRAAEASRSLAQLEESKAHMLELYADTMFAIGRPEAARDAVLASLNSPQYHSALEYLQPPISFYRTEEQNDQFGLRATLRDDHEVLEALNRVGRIVDIAPIALDGVVYPAIDHQS